MNSRYFGAVLILATVSAGCTTTGSRDRATPEEKISYASTGNERLGVVVRQMGPKSTTGIVLMQGLEWQEVGQLSISALSPEKAAQQLAAIFNGKVQDCGEYLFLYPQGYESLENVSLEGQLDPALAAQPVAVTFGAGTALYTVFAAIGKTLETTVVADNAIAQAECGELALPEMPLQEALEAVLKSARVPAEPIDVRGNDEYVFLRNRAVSEPATTLLNEPELSDSQRQLLDHRVSVELPYPQAKGTEMAVFSGAVPLEDVLPSLSRQLGVPVTAERDLAKLPINPMVAHNLPRRLVMDLLIRQWLVAGYGYTADTDRIVIRRAQS